MAKRVPFKLAESVVLETVERLGDLLIQEAASLLTVNKNVERLRNELTIINSFLRDADTKQEKEYYVRNWISKVIDLCHHIEDVIEIFITNVKFSNFITKPFLVRLLRNQIASIQTTISDMISTAQGFDIQSFKIEQARSFVAHLDDAAEEDDFVSLEASTEALKAQLTNKQDELSIVFILGMRGLGRTTLANRVYNEIDVKRRFDCCAWVSVSSEHWVADILYDIVVQLGIKLKPQRCREVDDMISILNRELKDKQYLVVLDDVRRVFYIENAFPKGKKGSKVLITTCDERVASVDLPSFTFSLPSLNHEDSYKLLCKKAFQSYSCPSGLEQMGKEMVNECKGLPLAIIVLGGLLRMKKSEDEWGKVHSDLKSQLNKRGYHYPVENILALSYYHLPCVLKPCFLYLGNFPEYREIPKKKIIRLWLAEGFLTAPTCREKGTTLEDAAENYLEELIHRNMVQVGKRDHTGGVKTCRLHDLMRDLAISKAKEEKFYDIMQLQCHYRMESSSLTSFRRTAAYFDTHHEHDAIWMRELHPNVRSLLCFDIPDLSLIPISKEQLGMLRVLEVDFVRGKTNHKMSRKIGDLIHLRYLGLRGSGISELPATIANLQNLLTLDLRNNSGVILHGELSKLGRLIHLLLPLNAKASNVQFDKLTNIETLKFVEAADLIRNDAKSTLIHVRNLGIKFKSRKEPEVILKSPIVNSGHLQSLTMYMPSDDSFSSLQPLTDCRLVQKLDVTGKIRSGLNFLPQNLTKLVLVRSELQRDPMEVLEKLPELKCLILGPLSYKGAKMSCSAGGFLKLETLQLKRLFQVEEWRMERYALPSLKRLDIEVIPLLRMLPEEIIYVITLQELNISMHQSFGDRLKGEDSYKVQKIASVTIL